MNLYSHLIQPTLPIIMIDEEEVLTTQSAEKQIKEIAKVTEDVIFGDHAREQQDNRGIEDVDVFRVLRTGFVDDVPTTTEYNEQQCKIVCKLRGLRSVGVVLIFLEDGTLFIKTVEWEDL